MAEDDGIPPVGDRSVDIATKYCSVRHDDRNLPVDAHAVADVGPRVHVTLVGHGSPFPHHGLQKELAGRRRSRQPSAPPATSLEIGTWGSARPFTAWSAAELVELGLVAFRDLLGSLVGSGNRHVLQQRDEVLTT